MSDKPTIPQKPPFEETEAYKELYRHFADYAASVFITMEKDIVAKLERNDIADYVRHTEGAIFWEIRHKYWEFEQECKDLKAAYERDEL